MSVLKHTHKVTTKCYWRMIGHTKKASSPGLLVLLLLVLVLVLLVLEWGGVFSRTTSYI